MELVTTISGKNVPKDKCREVNGKYYLIGNINSENSGDIFEINNRFIRLETDRLIFNITKAIYELKSSTVANEGYVFYDGKEFIKGWFEFNGLYDKILIDEKKQTHYVLASCKIPYSYRERMQDGKYYHISLVKAISFFKKSKVSRQLKESFNYSLTNSSDVERIFLENYKPVYNYNIKKLEDIIGGLSFGLEFETIDGIIPNNKSNYLPLVPLRDGSISGLEYVTIPLKGAIGIQAVIDSLYELNKRTSYDSTCSLHLHIGNIPRTPEFILALFKLYSLFSEQIYGMFPLYKEKNYGVKRKNYTKPFDYARLLGSMDNVIDTKDKVNNNFSVLFDYLAESERSGMTFNNMKNDLNNVEFHPLDRDGRAKWNINNRYHVLNFVPLIFTNKSTVEFRIHTPTFDVNKVINFMLISSTIVNMAKIYQKEILNNFNLFIRNHNLKRLENCLISYSQNTIKKSNTGDIMEDLISYIRARESFHHDFTRQGHINYNEDDVEYGSFINYLSKPLPVYKETEVLEKESDINDSYYRKYDLVYRISDILSGEGSGLRGITIQDVNNLENE